MPLSVLLHNFGSYDWIIFAAFAANLAVFYFARKASDELYAMLHDGIETSESDADRDERLARMYGLRGRAGRLYAIYANVTAIFPLLGILGTVIALLGMTGNLDGMEENFLAALTSTFWGLIASIVFKFLDSFISYKAESNEVYLSNYEETGKRYTVIESYAPDLGAGVGDHEKTRYHH